MASRSVPLAQALTAGFLIASNGMPRLVSVVPLLWAVIGSSAAFALGVRADMALAIAAGLLALDFVFPSVLGRLR